MLIFMFFAVGKNYLHADDTNYVCRLVDLTARHLLQVWFRIRIPRYLLQVRRARYNSRVACKLGRTWTDSAFASL